MKARRMPRPIVVVALIAFALAVLHTFGVRRSTSALAGIASDPVDTALALAYIGCWFFTVLIAPIALLAWGLLRVARVSPRAAKEAGR